MKFTYPQKKWVLTTALLAVLGVNVSFNSHSDGIASADFASTSGDLMESKVYTADGVMPVKYIDNGDEEVLALVPKKTTEGKICTDKCGYDTITLSVKNKSDIDSLNVELMKQLAKESAASKKKVVKKEEVEEDAVEATEEVAEKKKVDYFAGIRQACKNSDSDIEKTDCYAERLPDLLESNKKITTQEANQFFTKEVQPSLLRSLSQGRNAAYFAAHAANLNNPAFNTFENRELVAEGQSKLAEILSSYEKFISNMPASHETIRQKVFIAQSEILKYEASLHQDIVNRIKASKDPNETAALIVEKDKIQIGASSLANSFTTANNEAISAGQFIGNISDANAKAYRELLSRLNIEAANIHWGTTPATQVTVPSIDLSARMQNPGRGANIGVIPGVTPVQNSQIGVIPQQGTTTVPAGTNPVSTRTGATLSAPLTTSGGGVSFGTPREATAEALQMRQQIRGRQ
nr:hypothetical protein CKG001_29400 [Bdellovibrio sp. CKG001]BFD64246.1 hypothetical protein BdHM001_29270 [Bdellovibrio sp. HM001]